MKLYEDLQFDTILKHITELCASSVVADNISSITPVFDAEAVNMLLTKTGDALNILASHTPVLSFDDIKPLLNKVKVGGTLSPAELLSIKQSIYALKSLKNCIENAEGCDSLKDIIAFARVCDELAYEIDKTVENENELKDGASEKLFSLRKSILRATARLKEKLDGYTRQSEFSKYLQDNIVTVRGGRYVLPVRSDCKSNVKGLVHDVSATGATIFIEPFAIVEANNELTTLKTEEFNEIERILAQLSRKVFANTAELAQDQDVLTECGVIFAKAEYAKKINGIRPEVNENGKIVLKGARHPLIPNESVVPVDISMDKERVLLISGPNTGGKTVALKTVGLFALLTGCGIFIPADKGSVMSVFDSIYCDIGDSQSIEHSLSTFSAHIKNLAEITEHMDEKSLVLLDEVGDGTDPDEGTALAVAVIKKILSSRAVSVVTTHFGGVKEFAMADPGIASASMQFDSVNFKPTYRLMQGVAGSSYALEIAEKLGLGQDIICDAKAALNSEKVAFDKIIKRAEQMRNETFEEKRKYEKLNADMQFNANEAQKLRAEYESKLAEITENSRAIIRRQADEYAEKAENIIEEIKRKLKAENESALFEARAAAKKIYSEVPQVEIKPYKSSTPSSPNELTDGTRVFVAGLNKEGTIVGSLRGNKAVVAIGSVKTEVPISSLSVIEAVRTQAPEKIHRSTGDPENKEIMLLGYTVDDAIIELDRIIADIAPHSTLRIVHGKGTGALGKGIQAFLRRNARIKSFRYGRYGEGDNGVTIAEIK